LFNSKLNSRKLGLNTPLRPTNGGRPCGGGWALRRSAWDRNDHQPPGSSYLSDTVLFSPCYSGCLLICIISKWL